MGKILFREVVKRHPRLVHLRQKVYELDFNKELHQRVGEVLEFSLPGGKSKDIRERKLEAEKVAEQNLTEVFKFLAKEGYKLDPEMKIKKSLEKTIKVLHENGIFHRDLDLRNVMIGKDGCVYIIDFEKAWLSELERKDSDKETIYDAGGGSTYPEDEGILGRLDQYQEILDQYTRKYEEEKIKKEGQLPPELAQTLKDVESSPKNKAKWIEFKESIVQKPEELTEEQVDKIIADLRSHFFDPGSSIDLEMEVLGLWEINKLNPGVAREFIVKRKEKIKNTSLSKEFSMLDKILSRLKKT